MSSETEPFPTLLDGRYRLRRLLGSGGMAKVYEAEDLRLARLVAIKIAEDTVPELHAERLVREARAAARTNHPGVVTVHAYGSDLEMQRPYIVLELLHGEDLAARLAQRGPLGCELVGRIGREIADALAAAHAIGIVHRDIKPANVFLGGRAPGQDEIKLLDFGIAKQSNLETITAPDQLLGTLPYMAPERLLVPGHASAAGDLYALGATLFECLTGKPPFMAKTPTALLAKILAGEVEDLSMLRPDAPSFLVEAILRCLRPEPSARYQNGHDLCCALQVAMG